MLFIRIIKRWMHNRRFYANSEGLAVEEAQCAAHLSLPAISSDEENAINNIWKGIINKTKIGYPGFAVFKHYCGFDPEYVPMSYAFPWILRILTRVDYARVLVNKCMTYNYFPNIRQPLMVGRVVGNCFFIDGSLLEKQQFIDKIVNCSYDMIFKQAVGSCGGHSIRLLKKYPSVEEVTSVLESYDSDFLIQEKIPQHPFTAQFNSSSLNTFRITTLLLNGKFSLLTAMLRFGSAGSVVDNLGSGGGCVGVNDDGTFMRVGYDNMGNPIPEWNSIKFDGVSVPNFNVLVEMCRSAHYNIPMCTFVGWDVAMGIDGSPVLIEANIDIPGVFFEQLANARPLFRNRFKEVMDYINKHPLPLEPIFDATN